MSYNETFFYIVEKSIMKDSKNKREKINQEFINKLDMFFKEFFDSNETYKQVNYNDDTDDYMKLFLYIIPKLLNRYSKNKKINYQECINEFVIFIKDYFN